MFSSRNSTIVCRYKCCIFIVLFMIVCAHLLVCYFPSSYRNGKLIAQPHVSGPQSETVRYWEAIAERRMQDYAHKNEESLQKQDYMQLKAATQQYSKESLQTSNATMTVKVEACNQELKLIKLHRDVAVSGVTGPTARDATTVEAIFQDMHNCSHAMGMSPETLQNATSEIRAAALKASKFVHTIWSLVPQRYSTSFRNPCWHSALLVTRATREILLSKLNAENRNTLSDKQVFSLADKVSATSKAEALFCMPYFFLAGFPKSGTSSLDAALRKHPQVANPAVKEPHWWTRIPLENMQPQYLKLAVLRYLLNFSDTASSHPSFITYDGSQSTLWDSNFFVNHKDFCSMPAVMSRVLPQAKFVVLMRNPITRLYSSYIYSCTRAHKWRKEMQVDPASHFHTQALKDTETFKQCLQHHGLYECVSENRFSGNWCGGIGFRITVSLYFVHLAKWLQFYPKENFLFLRTEDMEANPHKFMNQITTFLGLEPVSPTKAEQWFADKVNVQKINYFKDSSKLELKWETRRLLEEFYRPYNALLAELVGDNRFLWND